MISTKNITHLAADSQQSFNGYPESCRTICEVPSGKRLHSYGQLPIEILDLSIRTHISIAMLDHVSLLEGTSIRSSNRPFLLIWTWTYSSTRSTTTLHFITPL